MAIMKSWETELNAIRVKLHEETKELTIDERVKRTNERGQRLAAQYGFKIALPAATPDDMATHNRAIEEYRRGETIDDAIDWN